MILELLIFIIALTLLVKSSDHFVKVAATISKKLGVSNFIIGLTVVALGTSLPELASSVAASLKDAPGIIIGNIIGSNIANISLILGFVATLYVIKTKESILKRDGYIMLFITILFYIFLYNGLVSRIEAILMILVYIAYVIFLFELNPQDQRYFREFINYFFKFRYVLTVKSKVLISINNRKNNKKISPAEKKKIREAFKESLIKDFLILIISGGFIVLSANYLIEEAIFFAKLLNISENIIGISLIAVGTSLPELSVSLSATKKGYGSIALGNILGSNIANILFIGGIASLIKPLIILPSTISITAPFMIIISALLLIFIRSGWKIERTEGLFFLILYTAFMTFLITSSLV